MYSFGNTYLVATFSCDIIKLLFQFINHNSSNFHTLPRGGIPTCLLINKSYVSTV